MRKNPHPRRIVLADPPVVRDNPQATAFPNLGLLYLATALRCSFPDHEVVYINANHGFADHVELVANLAPTIYGLSFASPYVGVSLELMSAVKKRTPGTVVICGGAHPTADPEGVLAASAAEICCIGEGDVTGVEIVRTIVSASDLAQVAGIAFKDGAGTIRTTPRRPFARDLDSLGPPAWDLVDFSQFGGCRKRRGNVSTAIVASRGCPFNCTFCSNPVWKTCKPWFRTRSAENVAEEVERLYQRGIREIYIRSDEMNGNLGWAITVFEELARLCHPDLTFQCNLRATPVTLALVDAMARAGCWLCHLGIESGSQRVLDGIRKRVTLAQVKDALTLLKSRGIKTYGFFMLYQAWEEDGALRMETTREVMRTLKFILKLRFQGLLDHISWAFATPYPGSSLYKTSLKYHLMDHPARTLSIILPWEINMRLPGIPRMEMRAMLALGMLVQGCLFLCDRDSYNLGTAKVNVAHALHKLRFSFHH